MTAEPAYTRLDVDERRRRLLALGADLFTRFAYDELSMAKIAKEAGISKALLYHYFPSKEAYFVATLEEKAEELQQRTAPDRTLPPLEQLAARSTPTSSWIEENASSYDKMIRSRGSGARGAGDARPRARATPRSASSTGCAGTSRRHPLLRTAVRGWLGFMDGACLDWIAHDRDLSREALHGLLLSTLMGAVLGGRRGSRAHGELASLEVDHEDERRRPGGSRPASPAGRSRGRRDDQQAPAALLHADDALVPARDDLPWPSENENGSPPRSHEASNFVPSLNSTPEYCMSTVCPAAAFVPLPTLRSL